MKLQRLHNTNPSRGDKALAEELERRGRLREERAAKAAEKDRKRTEAALASMLMKGPEVKGVQGLITASKGRVGKRLVYTD